MMDWKKFSGWKTYVSGGATVIAAVVMLVNGQMDASTCVQTISTALLAMFIRHGIETTAKSNTPGTIDILADTTKTKGD